MQHIIVETGCLTKIGKPCRAFLSSCRFGWSEHFFRWSVRVFFFLNSDHVLNSIIPYLLWFLGFLPSLWWSKWRLCHAQGLYCGQSEARTDSSQGNGSVIIVDIDKPCILNLRTLLLMQSSCWWEFALLSLLFLLSRNVWISFIGTAVWRNKCKEHQSSLLTL